MKRVPMGYEARLRAAATRRKRAAAGKAAVVLLAVGTVSLWAFALLQR